MLTRQETLVFCRVLALSHVKIYNYVVEIIIIYKEVIGMERLMMKRLVAWKESPYRKLLILKEALS